MRGVTERPSLTSRTRRAARLVALVLAAGVAGGVALAPRTVAAADSKAAAKAKLVEGADLLKRGEYQAALERFQSAYQLVPSPKIQFNFGLAYKGLGRNADAVEAFEKFLAEAAGATPDTVAKARQYREELIAKVGRLSVHADVAGASIVVDGRSYGTTPRSDEILLDPGPHLVLVERPGGGAPFTQRLDVAAGRGLTVDAKLTPEPVVVAKLPDPDTSKPPLASDTPGARNASGFDGPPLIERRQPEPSGAGAPRWVMPAAIATGSVAVLALGFGTVEWVIKEQKFHKFNQNAACDLRFADAGGSECSALNTDGANAKRLGYIGFAAGGALGVTAAGLFIWRQVAQHPRQSDEGHESNVACAPSPTGLGGACAWRF